MKLFLIKKRILHIPEILSLLLFVTVIGLSLYRAFFGVEFTDEAYSVAELYLVSQGGIPFVDNWSQMPGYAIILAPFIKLFVFLNGGTEGIFLFYRLFCDFIIILTMIIIYVLANKYFNDKFACLAFVLPFISVKGGGRIFRGDELSILMIGIAGLLFGLASYDSNKEKIYSLFSGFIMALAVMVYPSLIVTYFFMVFIGGIYEYKNRRKISNILKFLLGSVAAAILCIGYLAAQSSIYDVFNGVRLLLNDIIYWEKNKISVSENIGLYYSSIIQQLIYFAGMFTVLFCMIIFFDFIMAVLKKERGIQLFFKRSDNNRISIDFSEDTGKQVLLFSIVFGTVLDVLFQILRGGEGGAYYLSCHVTTVFLIATPCLLFFVKTHRKLCNLLFVFVWVGEELCKFFMGLNAPGGLYWRNQYLQNAAYLAIFFAALAMKDNFFDGNACKEKNAIGRFISKITPITLSGVMCMAFIFGAYGYVYRDSSFSLLTSKVTSGPYKGLYTTEERKNGVIEIEEYIRSYTTDEDYLLVMDNDPFIYLMSDAKPCTPSTWDMAAYFHGFDCPEVYYDYFEVSEKEPTKIIYMNYGFNNYGVNKIMSIDVDYKFNSYVNQNFNLVYENRNIFEWTYEGNAIMCELLVFDRKEW